ncbi:acyltransferase family protein [Pseudomonas sp. QE6]|uniref:acyltransferase family protein n=1 Tax=Pseudomonas sp. QE6 TaxID=3242491 RepID=UPI0035270985
MSRRICDIEVLRAFAVLAVVLHHINGNLTSMQAPGLPWPLLHLGGWFGVDLFFAISGFVIARDLIPRMAACQGWRASLAVAQAFWVRRIWRLLPSAWLWLALVLLAVLVFNQSGAFGTLRANLEATLAGVLNFANIRFANCFMRCEYGASFVYWSLSLEEQFYLLFPLLLFVARRYLPLALIALVLVQLVQVRTPWLMVFRTDALALGILLAVWSARPSHAAMMPGFLSRVPALATALLLGSVALLAYLASPFAEDFHYKVGLMALVSAALVWLASYDQNWFCRWAPLRRLMLWLGARSYAIYLIHVPMFFFVRELQFRLFPGVGIDGRGYFLVAFPVVLVLIGLLAELNYRFVEMPLRRRGARIADGIAKRPRPAMQSPMALPD